MSLASDATAETAPAARRPHRLAASLSIALAIVAAAGCLLQVAVPAAYDGVFPLPQLTAIGPWYAAPALPGLVLGLYARRAFPSLLAAAALVFLVVWNVPWWVAPDEASVSDAQTAGTVRVMTHNAYYGQANAAEIVELVREGGIEVLCLQETTQQLTDALKAAGLAELLPYWTGSIVGDQIWSALPLEDAVEDAVGYDGCAMPAATVVVGGERIRFVSIHTCAPMPGLEGLWHVSLQKVANIRDYDQGLRDEDRYVLMGDFNASYDHASFRAILDGGLRDAARGTAMGLRFTWPATAVPVVTLDHVLLDEGLSARDLVYRAISGSDHVSLAATVEVDAR